MRAVIRLKTNDNRLNQLSLEGFLQAEGYVVVDLIKDKNWLKLPDQKPLEGKITAFKKSIFHLEAHEIKPLAYIFNERAEGLISYNSNTGLYGIRIFKHNKDRLLLSCEKLVESLINYFERDTTKLEIQDICIREEGQSQDTIIGEIYKGKNEKIEKAKKDKSTEFKVGKTLFLLAVACILISLTGNFIADFEVEKVNNIFEWLIYFLERISGPLLITGSVLYYDFYKYKQSMIEQKTVVLWK